MLISVPKAFRTLALLWFFAAGCTPVLQPPYREFAEVDRLLERYVERGAFPGGVLAVGDGEGLIHLRPFGRLTYAANWYDDFEQTTDDEVRALLDVVAGDEVVEDEALDRARSFPMTSDFGCSSPICSSWRWNRTASR